MFSTMKRRAGILAVTAAVALGVPFGAGATATPQPVHAAKSCSSGYTHAVIGGVHKCLRAGQFCTHRYDRQYRRYGYRCTHYYRNVGRYRLTRA
jgi:hypothetical protein